MWKAQLAKAWNSRAKPDLANFGPLIESLGEPFPDAKAEGGATTRITISISIAFASR
jgi:hypothetical protein